LKLQTRGWSLRSRLLAIAGVSCVSAWLAGGAAIYYAVQRQDTLLFDARLADIAQTMLDFADDRVNEIAAQGRTTAAHIETEGTTAGHYRYQVWSGDERMLVSSLSAAQPKPLMPFVPLAETGWATQTIDGEPFRVVSLPGPGGRYRIQAAEPLSQRLAAADLVDSHLALGLGLSALVLGAMCLLLLRLALRPLHAATDQVARRGPADLRAVALEGQPAELAPLLAAINQLLQRLDTALRSERDFVAAAAHELRTPLAGLRAQAQLAAHPRSGPQERHDALQAVQDGVDHAAHLVAQLLDLARSDALAGNPTQIASERREVDIVRVFEWLLGELGPLAAERDLRLTQRFEVSRLTGSEFGIGLILRNLLANAVSHAPRGGEVALGTRADGDRTVLWVHDSGPGIAGAERERVFERFFRGRDIGHPGCGLGLSIVKALADAHGANVTLGDAALGGLAVEVAFPAHQQGVE
jgi:signal transduction histidine kinase